MGAAIVGALLVAAVVAVGALVAVPPSMANLASSTADGVASEPLSADADAGDTGVVPADGSQAPMQATPPAEQPPPAPAAK